MIRNQEPRSSDESGYEQYDRQVEPGRIIIRKRKEEKEQECATNSDSMHGDLKIDIAEKGAAEGKKRSCQEMNSHRGCIGPIPIEDPGPPIKDHGNYVWDDPFFLRAKKDGSDK